MNKRKDHLKALFGGAPLPGETPSPSGEPERPAPETKSLPVPPSAPPRSASGAVKAMGLSLNSVTREIDEARAIRDSLARGERVIEVAPEAIDPSPVQDRLSSDEAGDEDFDALVESMREAGQQVPVLLRPHPEKPGRYQVAYGHRRVRAAARLDRPVKAVVRALSDDELVLAQGKENSERRNLSFIERAFFAQALLRYGFDRGIAQQALSVHKADITRLLAVAEAVPDHIAKAIGPAPKAGRARWMALAEFLKRKSDVAAAEETIASGLFRQMPTDERFSMVFDRLAQPTETSRSRPEPRRIADGGGRVLARLTGGRKPKIEFDEAAWPGLADYIARQLPELAARFEKEKAAPRK